jgi:hypothetical protein
MVQTNKVCAKNVGFDNSLYETLHSEPHGMAGYEFNNVSVYW